MAQPPQCPQPFMGGPGLQDVCASSTGPLFLALLNTLLMANPKIGDPCSRIKPIEHPDLSYDFIIVGGLFRNSSKFQWMGLDVAQITF